MKKMAFAGVIILALIQFVQPVRNESGQVMDKDIAKTISVPEGVQSILLKSCYDCHSNNTNYPWYTRIQPGGWFMAYHVSNGKEKLNFNEFGLYPKRRQESKLDAIAKQIENEEMPLPSYLLLQRDAILSPSEKAVMISWASSSMDSLSANN